MMCDLIHLRGPRNISILNKLIFLALDLLFRCTATSERQGWRGKFHRAIVEDNSTTELSLPLSVVPYTPGILPGRFFFFLLFELNC